MTVNVNYKGSNQKKPIDLLSSRFFVSRFCPVNYFYKIGKNKKPNNIKVLNGSAGKIRTYDRSVNSRLTPCSVTLANPQKSRYAWVYSYHKMSIFVYNCQHLWPHFGQ